MTQHQLIIGRSEYMDIVDVAPSVPAKVDTGAYRSSIHASGIKVSGSDDNRQLSFDLLGHPIAPIKYPMTVTDFEEVTITNSFGHEEKRYEIKLRVKLGPKIFTTSFTLADRSNNFFPVLLGRKFLKNRYLVDIKLSSVDRMKLRKEFNITGPTDEEDLE